LDTGILGFIIDPFYEYRTQFFILISLVYCRRYCRWWSKQYYL